ncbi:MAG: methyltransferase domain-containing protein [Proteobacteria bacterium]|nr:methyltransferase domain-containing protein [Pseudomonadota bacterium]
MTENTLTPLQVLELAKSHYDDGAYGQAKAILEELARIAPQDPVVWKLMGATTLRLDDPKKAVECTERCLSLDPKDANAWGLLGEALRDSGSYEAAADAYLESVRLEPETLVLHEHLMLMIASMRGRAVVSAMARKWSIAFADSGRIDSGIEKIGTMFEKELRATQEFGHSIILRNFGNILFMLGRPEDAVAVYTRSTLPVTDIAAERGKIHDEIETAFAGLSPYYDYSSLAQGIAGRMATFVGNAVDGRSGLRVLDAACGTGLLGGHLRDRAEHLVGIDLSQALLDTARAKKTYHELVCGDLVQAMEEREDRFDLVTCCDALYFLADLSGFFAAAASRLAPGGVLAFTVDPCSDQYDVTMTAKGEYAHSRRYVRRLAAEGGLEEVAIEILEHRFYPGFYCAFRKPDRTHTKGR